MRFNNQLVPRLDPVCCEAFAPATHEKELVCSSCGHSRPMHKGSVLLKPELDQVDARAPDSEYARETKHRYQSDGYARTYLRQYSALRSPSALYARFIADKERAAVDGLLAKIAGELQSVLDIPAGTGKLSDVHAKYHYSVVGADVSAQMMIVGLESGAWRRCDNLAGFVQSDVTATEFRDDAFDCAVCLRLMHRLNPEIANRAVAELARISRRYLIVSTGVQRLSVSTLARGARSGSHRWKIQDWEALLSPFGEVVEHTYVSRLFSDGVVSLVRLTSRD